MKGRRIINVGIVGAGLIGNKRAEALKHVGGTRLLAVADIDWNRALSLSQNYKCKSYRRWQDLVKDQKIDVVIIATPNKFLMPIAMAALKNGKHLLCEKPFGRNFDEAKKIFDAGKKYKRLIQVGFNHRFHAAIREAKKIFDQGQIGKLLFIRARYGHGGRLGMEKEWRFQKNISGGGELLDQGVHIIDLCRWFAGDFNEVYGLAETKFWKTKLDDNTFVLMKNKTVTASFHVSTTNWKNIFSFELFGDRGFLAVDGKGGSYGEETLVFGRRPKKFGVPKIKIFKFQKDVSWVEEWKNFLSALQGKGKIIGDAKDGLEANRIIAAVYESSKTKKPIWLARER
ncbi:MAG: Gfo/Idh/MocA family oxidoreductase [Patescibacteria group bacterium]